MDKQAIIDGLENLLTGNPWGLRDRLVAHIQELKKTYIPKPLTKTQMNSIYLFCQQLSDTLNTLGLEMKVVLKPSYQIWWDKKSIHDHLWLTVQKSIFGSESVKDLKKVDEIDQVHERLMKMLIDKFAEQGLEFIPFPHDPNKGQDWAEGTRNIKVDYH